MNPSPPTSPPDPPAQRIALIVNPRATGATATARSRIARQLAGAPLEWDLVTRSPADTGALAEQAVREGANVVVSLGGDGTASDIAASLAGGPALYVPLPGGNANVFSRALGWPARMDAAVDALVAALRRPVGRTIRLGAIACDERAPRPFIINCGIGLDADTVAWIEAHPRVKHRLRHTGFALAALLAARGARGAPPLRVWTSDRPDGGEPPAESLEVALLIAACGRPYTYFHDRPIDLLPDADFSGRLRWLGVRRFRPGHLAALGIRALRRRPQPDDDNLVGGPIDGWLRVSAPEARAVQADGEPLGSHREMAIGPGPSLETLVPRTPS